MPTSSAFEARDAARPVVLGGTAGDVLVMVQA